MNNFLNVKYFGAAGDGIADDAAAIQSALDKAESMGGGKVYIPTGNYRIGHTLYIGDGTTVYAEPDSRLFVCEKSPKKRGDFLLSNRNPAGGNRDISVIGGTWDGNFDGKNNTKPPNLFDPNAFSGSTLNFVNIKNLTLQGLNMRNSVVYYIRMAKLDGFVIRDIHFSSDKRAFNQDGLHFGGEVRHGLIENITASHGQTNDDMIAFNADDSMVRLENLDLCCGPIEDITVRGVFAGNCYTGFRFLSVNSPIRNIVMEDIHLGCRHFALNMDGARYCRTPLIKPGEKEGGSGLIENVEIRNMTIESVENAGEKALILAETVLKNFRITNFRRLDPDSDKPTLLIANAPGSFGKLNTEGNTLAYRLEKDSFRWMGDFDSFTANSTAEGTLD